MQVRKNMHAIDATVGEEIQQHHFTSKLFAEGQGALCVNPF